MVISVESKSAHSRQHRRYRQYRQYSNSNSTSSNNSSSTTTTTTVTVKRAKISKKFLRKLALLLLNRLALVLTRHGCSRLDLSCLASSHSLATYVAAADAAGMLRRSITWESRSSRESPFGRERALKRKNKTRKEKNHWKQNQKWKITFFLARHLSAAFCLRYCYCRLVETVTESATSCAIVVFIRVIYAARLHRRDKHCHLADPKNILQLNCELTITISFAGVAPPGVAPNLTFTSCSRLLIKNRFDFN